MREISVANGPVSTGGADFLYAESFEVHMCGFHQGKPHEACHRRRTSQEIRGMSHPRVGGQDSKGLTVLTQALTA